MKTTADATISVDQLTAKFKMWQLYTQLLEYIRQGVYDLSHRVDGPLNNVGLSTLGTAETSLD